MPPPPQQLWNALIRTHHITSRKKIAKLKQAATSYAVAVLLHSGSPPGIMYVEGSKTGVEEWVGNVNRLRYKDYQLAARPAVVEREGGVGDVDAVGSGVEETESVKEFGARMQRRGVFGWWRRAMGYAGDDQRL
ncbi:uncharacterized protein LTR77_009817 [Saxophila tyrrhenica]|uniref:Uncharacterized protein n=1 Tax=Saxophila tyrrhenica TaxID=1690608 RepID=A0AAV9NY90_9PEZI|nr:hypothetical protein LTR77_009817 [Saxophila tyrrhenica]